MLPERIETLTEEQLLRDSPDEFIRLVFGYRIEQLHANILEHFEESKTTLDLSARGTGKSRIGNIGYASWCVCNQPDARLLILSDTDMHSVRFLNTIKNVLATSPLIEKYYGNIKGSQWSDHQITTSLRADQSITEASITALGMYSGAVTSGHYTHIIADDLMNFANTRTFGMRERAKMWWKTTVLPTLLPGGELRIFGTLYHYNDFYNTAQNELGYDTQVQPAIVNEGTSNERSIWEDFMPLHTRIIDGRKVKGLYEIREDLGRLIFGLQYMLSAELQKSGSIFKYNDFRFYSSIREESGVLYAEIDEE